MGGKRGELVGERERGVSGRGKERRYWQKNERKAVKKNGGIQSRPPSSPPLSIVPTSRNWTKCTCTQWLAESWSGPHWDSGHVGGG